MTTTTVRLCDLSIDPSNVGKTGRGEEPMFAASIRAQGVLEPLLVRSNPNAKGTYLIVNGGERFTALQYLKKKGQKAKGVDVTDDFTVRVEITERDDSEVRAVSLATNMVRADMHPVDEFEAFAERIKDGATVEELATEYARTVPEIRQALSLAAIAPEIRKAWRDGMIDGDAAEAYALTKDLGHQVAVFKKLKNRSKEEWAVRQEIEGDGGSVQALLRFVGEKQYIAAGHQINTSLFRDDERHAKTVDNVPALKAMANQKLEDEKVRLTKDGWGWVMFKDEAPKDLYAWRRLPGGTPTKEQKALAGCTVNVSYNGSLEIERGYIKPGVSVKIPKSAAQKKAAAKNKPTTSGVISAALTQRLSESLTKAMADVVAQCDLDAVIRMALAGLFCTTMFNESPVCLENKGAGARDNEDDYIFEEQLARLAKMPSGALHNLFAKTIGTALDLGTHSCQRMLVESEGDVEDEGVAALVDFVPQKPLQAALRMEFNAEDYFYNSPKAQALAALADMKIEPLKNAKQAALAKQAADAAKKAGWLPPQLRSSGYAGPKAPKKKTPAKRKARLLPHNKNASARC